MSYNYNEDKYKYTIFKDENEEKIWYLLVNRETPIDILKEYSKSENETIREAIAHNKNCPVEILKEYSKSENERIRQAIAHNQNCPAEILKEYSKSENERIRQAIAHNQNCPVEILEEYSKSENERIRHAIAHNQNCPVEILVEILEEYLKNDQSIDDGDVFSNIGLGIALNKNSTIEMLETLIESEVYNLNNGGNSNYYKWLIETAESSLKRKKKEAGEDIPLTEEERLALLSRTPEEILALFLKKD